MEEQKLFYGYVYIATTMMTYTFMLNNKEMYFKPQAFHSFYPKSRHFLSSAKIYIAIAFYAIIYQIGVFVISLPLASIITLQITNNQNLQGNIEIIFCFLFNIVFVPLLPTLYHIVTGLVSNAIITFITQKIESKLGTCSITPPPSYEATANPPSLAEGARGRVNPTHADSQIIESSHTCKECGHTTNEANK